MKVNFQSLITLSLCVFLLSGCGASTPFQRGQPSRDPQMPPPVEKPGAPEEPPPPADSAPKLNKSYFITEVLPLLEARRINETTKGCALCHGNPAPTFEEAEKLVVVGHPDQSVLFLKATGAEGSSHMAIWKPDSPEALKLILWISGKTLF